MPTNVQEYLRASDGVGEAVRAIVVVEREVGSIEINVDSVLNWPSKFIATSGMIDTATGTFDPATVTVFYGHINGTYIEIEEFAPGYADLGNQENEVIVLKPTTPWADGVAASVSELESSVEAIQETISDFDKKVFLAAHPVGSTYWNETLNVNPGEIYGGTWASISGVALAGKADSGAFNVTPGTIVGAETHTLTIAQMPSHGHNASGYYPYSNPSANWWLSNSGTSGTGGESRVVKTDATSVGIAESNIVNNTGGGGAHPIIQPTLVGYMWKRIA